MKSLQKIKIALNRTEVFLLPRMILKLVSITGRALCNHSIPLPHRSEQTGNYPLLFPVLPAEIKQPDGDPYEYSVGNLAYWARCFYQDHLYIKWCQRNEDMCPREVMIELMWWKRDESMVARFEELADINRVAVEDVLGIANMLAGLAPKIRMPTSQPSTSAVVSQAKHERLASLLLETFELHEKSVVMPAVIDYTPRQS